MLQIKRHSSIHDIVPAHWDSIVCKEDVFHSWQFIRVVEDSKVEGAEFYYLLFYEGETLIGSTVLSLFKVSLDLFITENGLVRFIKKLRPNFFTIKILMCGLPASFGQLNLQVTDEKYSDEITRLISEEMQTLSKSKRVTLLTVKEFSPNEERQFGQFSHSGFFVANSIPYMNLDIHWPTFGDYLDTLRHPYRRKIIKSLKKIMAVRPVIVRGSLEGPLPQKATYILSDPEESFAPDFCSMYLSVMDRAATKLEILNLDFFQQLFHEQREYKILSLVADGKVISSAILTSKKDVLIFMLVGRKFNKDEYDSYFNLVYGIIQVAIEQGYKKIKMGQTAYWVKHCVGCKPETRTIYFASRRPFVHWVLKTLKNVVFPEVKLDSGPVFKATAK